MTLPDHTIITRFDSIVSLLWEKVGKLKKQNKLLKEAKDIFLSRLMTGKIDIEKMGLAV